MAALIVIGGAVGAGLVGLAAMWSRTPAEVVPLPLRRKLSEPARLAAEVIAEEARAAGESEAMVAALIVNAYAESALDPNAVAGRTPWTGPHHEPIPGGEDSVGLFQLNARGGGKGLTVKERKDPRVNVRRILQELRAARDGWQGATPTIRQAERSSATVAELAGLFARDVERPADKPGAMRKRAALALDLFGPEAGTVPGSAVRVEV